MNSKSRLFNSLRNVLFNIGGQLLGGVLSFICRTIFINILGAEYLGISGLFINILSMLSLAELGVGTAITYSLYKPLAEQDEEKIKALMKLYASAYRFIGCIVAGLGLMLVPFLDYLVRDKPDIPDLTLIYLMFLTSSVVSYFFAHKCSLIIADQKQYVVTLYSYGFSIIQTIIQLIILIGTKNFLMYLAVQIICRFLNNYFISRQADKMFAFLNNKERVQLSKECKKAITKNVGALIFHKLGNFFVNSTDNIIISMFVGIYTVGIYSNYTMIVGIIENLISSIFSSLTASIGHLTNRDPIERSYEVFETIFFISFWLYSFCSIAFWILFNPFIKVWIGSQYLINQYAVLIIVINFFVTGMRQAVQTYKNTMGLFWNDRYKPLAESIINLVASVFLVQKYGIAGVLLGRLISTLTTCSWVEPYVLYKRGFNRPVRRYFEKYGMYVGATVAVALITGFACSIVPDDTFSNVILKAILCFIISNTLLTILFINTKEFRHVCGMARRSILSCMQMVQKEGLGQ